MRLLGILKRTLKSTRLYLGNCRQFGVQAAFWIAWKYIFPSYRGKKGMDFLIKWFDKKLEPLISEYKRKNLSMINDHSFDKIPIWICWLTGLDTRPELVRICNQSVEKNCPDNAEVHYITLDNYKDYINIPDYILQKYKDGKLCAAHFSDVIRFCLLSKYGGMWLDATVYTTDVIPENYINTSFYTQKVSNKERYKKEPSRAQWCGFIWSGYKNNTLFCFVRDSLFWYWKNYNSAIDYIFFDYIIKTAYNHLNDVAKMIDNQQPNNEEIWSLRMLLDQKYDESKYNDLCKKNIFHKLSYQREFLCETPDNHITFWGFLKESHS